MPAIRQPLTRIGMLAAVLAATVIPVQAPPAAAAPFCGATHPLTVPGAAYQQQARLSELTTAGTVASGQTDPADWAGLTPAGLPTPSGVPGVQVDGYFPDDSTTNTNHGWKHDSQFVVRLPDRWNGGLVITRSPATASSMRTTAPSPIGCWPAATPSRPLTRATPGSGSSATASDRGTPSRNGTSASPS